MSRDLDAMELFVAVAEAQGFRAAAARLGVTGSAVSQALRRLEERLGVPLLQRTTRSVRLTEAGEQLYAAVRPALEDVRSAIAAAGELGSEPRGALRLHVAAGAETYFSGPMLAAFLAAYPRVRLDVVVSAQPVDIVVEGYDAGVRLGEVIDKDMIAVPVSGDIRLVAFAAPSYFARRPKPTHPRDLAEHECIGWRPRAGAPAYRWEFTRNGRDFSVAVPARVCTTDPSINIRLALSGAGIAMAREDRVQHHLESGALVQVLDEFSAPFPGYYLYFPHRRQASAPLRALVEHVRGEKHGRRRGTARRTSR